MSNAHSAHAATPTHISLAPGIHVFRWAAADAHPAAAALVIDSRAVPDACAALFSAGWAEAFHSIPTQ